MPPPTVQSSIADLLARMLKGDQSWQAEPACDAETVVSVAIDHGVDALVWQALADGAGPAQDVRARLDARVRAAAARDLLAQRELRITLDTLARAGVHALVVKGAALAYSVYAAPWHRPRTDTDLLVAPGDRAAAERVLIGCGYTRSDAVTTGTVVSHQMAFERIDAHGVPHVIDLHWKIVNPHALADTLPFEDLWQRRGAAPGLGATAAVPSAVDSTVIAAIHRLAHHQGHDRLIWLYDLRLLTSRFSADEWSALAALADERHVASLCLDALSQARARLGAALPEAVERSLSASAPAEPAHRYVEGPVAKLDVLGSDLRMLTSWSARWRLLREHAFPPAAFIRQRYGVSNPVLLPALYLHRLVVGAVKWVR